MTQTYFRRGLDQEFVEKLNELYDQSDSWWRALVDDDKLFLAVRDNYVNIYYLGCSLLKLTWNPKTGDGDVVGETHYKYLLKPSLTGSNYIKIVDGQPESQQLEDMFTKNLADTDDLKKAAKRYAGSEKTGVHNIVLANPNIVDLEIAFAASSSDSASLIDFAALKKTDRGFEIVFFEAKDFSNGALRASGDADPKVIGQIERYKNLLEEDNCGEISVSYRRVCGNLFDLRGLAKRHHERHEILKGIADGSTPLTVNDAPRLVVFGFDEAQRVGKDWKPHLKKLKDKLGEDRVLLRGGSKDFTRDISP
jgi:hypothetical protein